MSAPRRIVVTGASGFIGAALVARLAAEGHRVVAVARSPLERAEGVETEIVASYADAPWARILAGAEAVVHAAGLAHARLEPEQALARSREANVEPVRRIAHAGAQSGLRRIVLLSTVKVLGERTRARPFADDDRPAPLDAYARSKLESEEALEDLARGTSMQTVVLRLPLVHGPGVKGNLLRLLALIGRGVPLPLAAVVNRRSLLGLDNAVSAIGLALAHPAAAGARFLVADEEAVSTPELVRRLARGLGRPPRLFPAPLVALRALARLTGQSEALGRLVDSLEVDGSRIRSRLGWTAPRTLDEGLAAMARWYVERRAGGD